MWGIVGGACGFWRAAQPNISVRVPYESDPSLSASFTALQVPEGKPRPPVHCIPIAKSPQIGVGIQEES